MISAPSHLPRLSGNRIGALSLILFVLMSCSTPKSAGKTPPPKPPSPPAENQVKVFDPVTGTDVWVPRSSVKVDTVKWTEDPAPPLVVETEIKPELPNSKKKYTVSLMLPLDGDQHIAKDNLDQKLNRFLQYYAGMQLAIRETDSLALPLSFYAYDADGTITSTEALLKKTEPTHFDVIVGPYEKESLEAVANFGLKHESMVISPWLPAFTIASENPFFIQVVPGLGAHAESISQFLVEEKGDKKIFLVARNTPAEINRLALFKKNKRLVTEDLIISDSSPDLERTELKSILAEEGTVFVLPYYAKSDEAFVNSFLRKLHADKELKEVMVIGLPQWLGFSNLNANYLESLSVHLSVSTFMDIDAPAYASFRHRFFSNYHTVPDLQAFLGYDLIKWISSMLMKGGQEAFISALVPWEEGIASGYQLRPVYKNSTGGSGEMKTPLYYENMHIRIVKYEAQDYHLVK